jgi:hypothetical protein
MAASYPTTVRTLTAKIDIQDTILADHVNALQDEVKAIETIVGTSPNVSTYSGTFAQNTTWGTLTERISNLEAGIVNGVGTSPYIRKSGDTITAITGTVGLTIKPASGTGNLLDTRTSSNGLGFNVNYAGIPKVSAANVLYVGSTEYTTLNDTATAALAIANAVRFDPFLLAGM